MWLRYKHKFAYAIDKEWSYYNIGDYKKEVPIDVLDDILEEIANEYHWSDKYRGIDYDLIECPPRDVLEGLIKESESAIESYKKTIDKLNCLIRLYHD